MSWRRCSCRAWSPGQFLAPDSHFLPFISHAKHLSGGNFPAFLSAQRQLKGINSKWGLGQGFVDRSPFRLFCQLEKLKCLKYHLQFDISVRVSSGHVTLDRFCSGPSDQALWQRRGRALLLLLLHLKNHCQEITTLGSNLKIAQWVCSLHLFSVLSRALAERSTPDRCLRPPRQARPRLLR